MRTLHSMSFLPPRGADTGTSKIKLSRVHLSPSHAVQESERQTHNHQHEVQHLQGNTAELRQALRAAASKHQAGGSRACLRTIPGAAACHRHLDRTLST